MKSFVMFCCGFICLVTLISCANAAEDKRYLTPIPESTLMAFREGTPVTDKLQAVIAASAEIPSSRMESLQPPAVIFVEQMTLAEAQKKTTPPGVESFNDIPANTPVWLVIFEGEWQLHSPIPGQTATLPSSFHGCQFVWMTANGNGYSATGNIDCTVH